MPLFFLVIGLVLIVTVINGTTFALARQLKDDLTSGYIKWFAAVLLIGAAGYVDALKSPSRYLLALIFLVIMLTNGTGFISMFIQQVQNPGQAPTPQPAGGNANLPAIPVQSSGGGGAPGAGAGGAGGVGSTVGGAAGTAIGGPAGGAIGSLLGGLFGR